MDYCSREPLLRPGDSQSPHRCPLARDGPRSRVRRRNRGGSQIAVPRQPFAVPSGEPCLRRWTQGQLAPTNRASRGEGRKTHSNTLFFTASIPILALPMNVSAGLWYTLARELISLSNSSSMAGETVVRGRDIGGRCVITTDFPNTLAMRGQSGQGNIHAQHPYRLTIASSIYTPGLVRRVNHTWWRGQACAVGVPASGRVA